MNGNDFEHKHLIVLRSVTSPSNKFCFLSFFLELRQILMLKPVYNIRFKNIYYNRDNLSLVSAMRMKSEMLSKTIYIVEEFFLQFFKSVSNCRQDT